MALKKGRYISIYQRPDRTVVRRAADLETEKTRLAEAQEKTRIQLNVLADKCRGKRIIIRTLDIGADKQVDYFHLKKEENPAMGLRVIRICLNRPEVKEHCQDLYAGTSGINWKLFPVRKSSLLQLLF